MFTGIIETTGRVERHEKKNNGNTAFFVEATFVNHEPVVMGESIANNGVCLTVVSIQNAHGTRQIFEFDLAPETLACTNLGALKVGAILNLERSLRVGDRLSGHWVQGHVDGLATLIRSDAISGNCFELEFEIDDDRLSRYCIQKGSISLNGVSLTIHQIFKSNSLKERIIVQIIPHTWAETNLSVLSLGEKVNIEVDWAAKYLERFKAYDAR